MSKIENFNPLDFKKQKILITGASSGIGRATAIYLSKLNASIVLSGRRVDKLKETQNLLSGSGHMICAADLATDDLEDIFKYATQDKKLDGIVHCAGIPYVAPLRSLKKQNMLDAMNNNFLPFIELCRLFSNKKYSEGGSIVAVSSILTQRPRACETAYISSKGALDSAVESLAFELATKEIRINGVLVGNVLTEMTEDILKKIGNENHIENAKSAALLGLGSVDQIASAIAFLLSDMASFITGTMVRVDGGIK